MSAVSTALQWSYIATNVKHPTLNILVGSTAAQGLKEGHGVVLLHTRLPFPRGLLAYMCTFSGVDRCMQDGHTAVSTASPLGLRMHAHMYKTALLSGVCRQQDHTQAQGVHVVRPKRAAGSRSVGRAPLHLKLAHEEQG